MQEAECEAEGEEGYVFKKGKKTPRAPPEREE